MGSLPIIAASVKGARHLRLQMPCQDACDYSRLEHGWLLAVVSDGMGSGKYAEIGSKMIVNHCLKHLEMCVHHESWFKMQCMPSQSAWEDLIYLTLQECQRELCSLANTSGISCDEYAATVIVALGHRNGVCIAHIGDGRAAVKNAIQGGWEAIMTPHRGEYSNQTTFVTMPNWVRDRKLLEARVVNGPVYAIALLTDGCEHAAFVRHRHHVGTQQLFDPNLPDDKFFEPLYVQLRAIPIDIAHSEQMLVDWQQFLMTGTPRLRDEDDDKTLLLACLR